MLTDQRPEGPLYTVENCLGWQVTVMVDGQEIKECVEANTAEGWVMVRRFADFRAGMIEVPAMIIRGNVVVTVGERLTW